MSENLELGNGNKTTERSDSVRAHLTVLASLRSQGGNEAERRFEEFYEVVVDEMPPGTMSETLERLGDAAGSALLDAIGAATEWQVGTLAIAEVGNALWNYASALATGGRQVEAATTYLRAGRALRQAAETGQPSTVSADDDADWAESAFENACRLFLASDHPALACVALLELKDEATAELARQEVLKTLEGR